MVVSLLPKPQHQPIAGDHQFALPTVRPLPRPPLVQAPNVW
ncbi:hypothetical protein [Baekduia sp. Peel2402]